jgi:hypothetical protein
MKIAFSVALLLGSALTASAAGTAVRISKSNTEIATATKGTSTVARSATSAPQNAYTMRRSSIAQRSPDAVNPNKVKSGRSKIWGELPASRHRSPQISS